MTREASCSCGQLRVTVEGEPLRVSVCHCLACQRRTGSAFGYQARFSIEGFEVEGDYKEYIRYSDDEGEERRFCFCPECGSTVFYRAAFLTPDFVAIPVGAFADPSFPPPGVEVYESRRHAWVQMPDGINSEGG
jgi:hypothetical protein